jgi:uncharacterized protein (DUF1330 family)
MKAYARAAASPVQNSSVTVLAADPAPQLIEGAWYGDQTVILEFESVDAARAFYFSEDYQKAVKLRQSAADSNVVIVSGFEMPGATG